jgi:hypothetical protein
MYALQQEPFQTSAVIWADIAMTASFHALSNSLFSNQPAI